MELRCNIICGGGEREQQEQLSSTFRPMVSSTAATRTHEQTSANACRRHYQRRRLATGKRGGRPSATHPSQMILTKQYHSLLASIARKGKYV
eukprot:scaffold1283_cov364-Pavlova_lutheri.AAC.4